MPVRWLPKAPSSAVFAPPRLIMNVLALARAAKEDPSLVATREELSRQLAGNLCRCSGYESQLRAIVRFLDESGVQMGFEMPELPVNDTSCDGVSYKQITHKQPKKDSKALRRGTSRLHGRPGARRRPDRQAQAQPVCPRQDPLHRYVARPEGARRRGRLHLRGRAPAPLYYRP